uniref:Uncharacterized protein n=1 Tax=Anguilla anguilla TaxID=7936 RepID=A0A0E9XL88_ANGAN
MLRKKGAEVRVNLVTPSHLMSSYGARQAEEVLTKVHYVLSNPLKHIMWSKAPCLFMLSCKNQRASVVLKHSSRNAAFLTYHLWSIWFL